MKDPLRTTVRKVAEGEYHCYLVYKDKAYDELICTCPYDVKFCFYEMAKRYYVLHKDESTVGGVALSFIRNKKANKQKPRGPITKGELMT